ncbi:hypothetical protein ACOQNP_24015 [Ectopseudomonas khazarica]|uniref:hypothetical protein n=1 Tax=Ectopseudomonas khazarica TaxID=2502979 RepID=UPI003B934957
MNTAAKKETAKYQEVAGKTWSEAIDFANRHGYGVPVFASRSEGMWVLRFEVKP